MSDLSKINFSGTEYNLKDTTARTEAGKKVTASGGDISNTKIVTADSFTSEFPVPAAGDTAKGFLGKMKKFCTDFNSFKTGVITLGKLVNNGLCTESGYALDARMGKTLQDLITQLNADFAKAIHTESGLAALQANSGATSTRIQVENHKDYAELFRSTDSWETYKSLGILAFKDDLANINPTNTLQTAPSGARAAMILYNESLYWRKYTAGSANTYLQMRLTDTGLYMDKIVDGTSASTKTIASF